MQMNSIFEINNLYVSIKKRCILDNIEFKINEATIVGFLGPNGSGKTTTIRACADQVQKTSGKINCNGINIDKNYVEYMLNVGFTFDKANFYPDLTGYQNLKLIHDIYPKENVRSISECVSMVKLENRITDKVRTYSFGMKQRLNFAKTLLLKDAKIIIMDEPLNGVDPEGVVDFRNLVFELKRNCKCSFLISSHLLSELETISDRLLFIKGGKIVDNVSMEEKFFAHYITTSEVSLAVNVLNSSGINAIAHSTDVVKVTGEEAILSLVLNILLKNNISFTNSASKKQIEEMYLNKVGGEIID